jgi:hypothetical protein
MPVQPVSRLTSPAMTSAIAIKTMRLITSNPLATRGDGLAVDDFGEVSVSDITAPFKDNAGCGE